MSCTAKLNGASWSERDTCKRVCSPCRLVALAATLQPDAGTQQRQVMQSGLSLALRLGVPVQNFLQRLLDPQHGLTFYGESARNSYTQHAFQWLDSDYVLLCYPSMGTRSLLWSGSLQAVWLCLVWQSGPEPMCTLLPAGHFKPVVHSWLIFNIGKCAQPLLEALAGSDRARHRPAGLLLTGMLEVLIRGRTAATVGLPDPRIRWATYLPAFASASQVWHPVLWSP